VGILLVALGMSRLVAPEGSAVLLAAFGCLVLAERLGHLELAGLPAPGALRGQGVLTALCSGGAALALVWLVGEWMPRGLVTLGWVVAAFGAFAVGFAVRERWYRFAGLGVLGLALGRLLFVDLARLPTDQRVLTFILLGVLLLVISYTYTRLRDRREER
jgi:hypothetical protein